MQRVMKLYLAGIGGVDIIRSMTLQNVRFFIDVC
jgi:hypothetical protein